MVLFITGSCGKNCFYCPVSYERKEKDLIFANERRVGKDEDIIEEAISMEALGTGITGGEPLLRLDRVVHCIKLLKNRFGKAHHIHLYTALAPNRGVLEMLKKAGLDEIRFHPPRDQLKNIGRTYYRESIHAAHELGLSAGIEIPSLPSDFGGIISLLGEVGGFLNLNELEISETNAEELKDRGFVAVDDVSSAIFGSKEVALLVHADKIHFCSSRFKDAVQLRERFKRIAKMSAREFDEITEDGTLVYGAIEGGGSLSILKEAGVTDDMYSCMNGTIETTWWIVSDLAEALKKKGCIVSVIERYPMKNGMLVEKTPL
ncbi:MAG: radical SAM protein [Candidatus Methanoperedens sp.]|nr:radical SAM protein [Candidatus Methanoperedens sp.]MCZ7371353.1 radical SAM protein [Candidatus Methanoperedens sp.]